MSRLEKFAKSIDMVLNLIYFLLVQEYLLLLAHRGDLLLDSGVI